MSSTAPSSRMTGIGRVLVIVYAVMALAATGRSFVQIVRRFDEAPLAYALSALAAVVYILATLALVLARAAAGTRSLGSRSSSSSPASSWWGAEPSDARLVPA